MRSGSTHSLSPSVLSWLRCFDAAARCGSFATAALELHVSPGAVSQQVKKLETRLGHLLLRRHPTGLTLTLEGEQLLLSTETSFRTLDLGVQRLTAANMTQPVNVSCSPSFAMLWLTLRLGNLYRAHPSLVLNIVTESGNEDAIPIVREDVAAVVRLDRPGSEGPEAVNLLDEWLIPVASPAFIETHGNFQSFDDLIGCQLIHAADPWDAGVPTDGWTRWLAATGVDLPAATLRQGTKFNLSLLGVQAALDGQGIAMGRLALVLHYLQQGRLVAPFAQRLLSRPCYRLIGNASHPDMPKIRQWLVDEALRFRQQRDAFCESAGITIVQ